MKTVNTPRDELICGAIDRAEEIARNLGAVDLMYELERIRHDAERMEAKLVSRKVEAEVKMTKDQNQASAMTDEQKNTLTRIVDCLEILDKRARPFCRDCADGDGVICSDSGLNCDMRKLIADGRAALATPAQQTEAPKDGELLALLPGTYYMDPPDGGSVTVLEQLQRMAKDAERYRALRDSSNQLHEDDIAVSDSTFTAYFGVELDDAVDALITRNAAITKGKAK